MTKYIVSGYIGFDNFGDEAIARGLVETLKKRDAEKITLISSNPLKTAKLYDVNSCGMKDFFKDLMEADVLISGGGSLLQDVTSLKSLIYYLGVIYSAILFKKKVIIYAQGIGPINTKIGKIFTKFALEKASEITVRDYKSQALLSSWGIGAGLVRDPVFNLELPTLNEKGIVGIQLRDFSTMSKDFLEDLADEVVKRFSDKTIQLLSLQDSIDLDICNYFAQILKDKGFNNDIEVLNDLSINDVIDRITHLEYMIGMRFHANVVAIKSGVKTLAINYDIKVEKLAEEFHLPLINLDEEDFSLAFDNLLK